MKKTFSQFTKITKKIKLHKFIIVLLTIILVLLTLKIIYTLFKKYFKQTKFPTKFIENKQNKQNNTVIKEHFQENIWGRFIFYSNDNCGKCTQLKENLADLFNGEDKDCSKEINGCRLNNKLIKFVTINCNEEENSCYNVKSYPTFVLEIVKQNKLKEYTGVYSVENMKQWLQDQTNIK